MDGSTVSKGKCSNDISVKLFLLPNVVFSSIICDRLYLIRVSHIILSCVNFSVCWSRNVEFRTESLLFSQNYLTSLEVTLAHRLIHCYPTISKTYVPTHISSRPQMSIIRFR